MTKLSNIPAKETTAKTAKTRKAKTEPAKPSSGILPSRCNSPKKRSGNISMRLRRDRSILLKKYIKE